MVDVNKKVKQQVQDALKQQAQVEEVEVTLKYKPQEEPNCMQDVNKHKGKGMMYE